MNKKLIVSFRWFIHLIREYKEITLGLLLVGSFFDILYFAYISDVLFFVVILFYIFLIKVYRLEARDVLKLLLIYLVMLFVFFISESENYHTGRVTTWIFFLFFVYIFQEIRQLRAMKYEN